MIIRIYVEDPPYGEAGLEYDESREHPLIGHKNGDPPVDNDALHSALEVLIGYVTRKKMEVTK